MWFLINHAKMSDSLEMNGKTVREEEEAIWGIEHCNRNGKGNNYANCCSAEVECVGRTGENRKKYETNIPKSTPKIMIQTYSMRKRAG